PRMAQPRTRSRNPPAPPAAPATLPRRTHHHLSAEHVVCSIAWPKKQYSNEETQKMQKSLVGAPGFEPGTSRTPSVRATRLRYAPTNSILPRSAFFEKRQERPQRIAHIQQQLAVQQLVRAMPRSDRRALFRAAALPQMPPRAGDRKSLVVQQPLDLQDQLHIFFAIEPPPVRPLLRLQHGKL